MQLTWKGEAIKDRIARATRDSIDEITEATADDAQRSHWWQSRHGRGGLEGQIISEPARVVNGRLRGRVGTLRREGFYGLILEYKRPWLRPPADRNFPKLKRTIRKRFIGGLFR